MEKFFKLALYSLIGLILASFALGLIQDNQTYNNTNTPYGPYGYNRGMMGPGPGKHMGGKDYFRPGMQGTFEFEYNTNYGN